MPFLGLDSDQQGQTEEAKLDYYRALMAGTPKLKVVPVAPSRHFAMFDQPQAVDEAIETFLKTL
jgi:pimeloyl-ACP methyl ester carboxylesterase